MKPIDPDRVRRLLIRGTNWVGDAVMSVPALREIRRVFGGAHISLLIRPWVRDVYAAADFLDETLEYDKNGKHAGWRGGVRLISELRRGGFDAAILLQNAFEAALYVRAAGIPLRVGYKRDGRGFLLTHPVPVDPGVRLAHQVYYYLGILSGAGLIDAPESGSAQVPSVALPVREADRASARSILRQRGVAEGEMVIGVNPGAFYGSAKRWLPDRYAAVADRLARERAARIVIFGGPNERGIAREIAAMMSHPPLILAGETSLGQLMGLLKECRLLITNDSGPMHLAAALDVPQVAIFGSSSDVATGPLSRQATVVKHAVDCSPCFLRECPIDFRCMTGISAERVYAVACEKLDRGGPSGA